jgi:hypothetical protein
MRPIAFTGAARRLTPLFALLLSCFAWAGEPGAGALQATPATGAAAAADTSRVYPPLPTLAMLPPSSSEDDDIPAPHSVSHKRKTHQRECHCTGPMPRLVVSDASRAYLKDIERQLDVALAR